MFILFCALGAVAAGKDRGAGGILRGAADKPALALAAPIAAAVTGILTSAIMAATWKISPRRE